jgi:hypothetical protein
MTPGRVATTNRLLAVLDTDATAAAALADQAVDLAVYVAALRDGRTVLSVLTPGDAARQRARRALAGAGAHFMNFFGRFATVDVAPWRGPELPLPPWLRR